MKALFQVEGGAAVSDFIALRNGNSPNKQQAPYRQNGKNQDILSEIIETL